MNITGQNIRETLLQVVEKFSKSGSGFQQGTVLAEVAERLKFRRNIDLEQALLTLWHNLFRDGHLAWGYNIDNPNPPFCHLTEKGREALIKLSRDPANSDGYLAHLRCNAALGDVAMSYIAEALRTYNSVCIKATAVMVGCAAESVALSLRDSMVTKIQQIGKSVPSNLNHWMIRTILTALSREIDLKKDTMQKRLREAYEAYWPAFIQQIRVARNDAGHPSSIDPVSDDTVHASLLIFPELAIMAKDLDEWIKTEYE